MTIWLFGDSIFRGTPVVRRSDLISAERAAQIPLWSFRSPAAVMNLLLGEGAVRSGGRTRLPNGVKHCARELAALYKSEDFRKGDFIVMLDVGQHVGDPNEHEALWRALRRAAVARRPARLLICEGFDNGARGQITHQYSRPFCGRTMNEAIRAAALEAAPEHRGVTSFVPVAAAMERYHRLLSERFGMGAYNPDGIHLNVWGQFRLCGILLQAIHPSRPIDLEPLLKLAADLEPHLDLKGEDLREAIQAAFGAAGC